MFRNLLLITLGAVLIFLAFHTNAKLDSEPSPNGPSGTELVDPEMAPAENRNQVVFGFKILLETKKILPEYAGDTISCTNCHFSAGNSFGGRNNGISLVGVTKHYPKKLPNGGSFTLADRINGCFERSMNGKPLPTNSKEMEAMLAYLEWISTPVIYLPKAPWLGLPKIESNHIPNPEKGGELFALHCAECHGTHGQGQQREDDLSYPPLWGTESFNNAAGMNNISMLAPFIYLNMPYEDATLTEEEALDIAAFVISQPRPTKEN
jgi:thiosulfate dehydrogenase